MVKKLIWAAIELITIVIGTAIFVESTLHSEESGIGAAIVVLGLLLKDWRKDLFAKQKTTGTVEEKEKSKASDKILIMGILLISYFTLWGVNYNLLTKM